MTFCFLGRFPAMPPPPLNYRPARSSIGEATQLGTTPQCTMGSCASKSNEAVLAGGGAGSATNSTSRRTACSECAAPRQSTSSPQTNGDDSTVSLQDDTPSPSPPPGAALANIPQPTLQRCSSRVFTTIDKSEHNLLVPMEMLGKPIESVYRGVHDGPELGTGITGIVRKVTHRGTGHEYAVKKLDLGKIQTEAELQQLREEIAIMCQLDHPNVVKLEEVYESPTAIYLVQELCLGGDLFDRLESQDDVHYTEAGCARIMKQIVDAVRYIHDKGIIHRDLKLENFMFSNESAESELRMIDFGLSKHFNFGDVHDQAVGSAYTVAPEVLRGKYNEKADEWSIGVITYLLLSGDSPFGGCGEEGISLMQTKAAILSANYEFEPKYIWDNVSEQAIDFIKKLLVTNPDQRPSVKDLQKSEWLQVWADVNRKDEDKELSPNIVQALVSFKEKDDMLKLLSEVLSFTLLPGQLEELRKQFEIMDPEGRGEISLGALKRALLNNAGAGALGSLTEEEVEDIFEAMRVRKGDMRIHWHEFIAAALSQVKIDDRNLELAFQRLDAENRGYIEVENIIDLMGGYVGEDEGRIREMWQDVFEGRNIDTCRRVSKKEFLLLMKGQRREKATQTCDDAPPLLFESDSGRAVSLPAHTDADGEVTTAISEGVASPLVVNRMLYRAHRQTRLAVLEASRRFEEEQMKRTAKKLNEALHSETSDLQASSNLYRANLIMRHSDNAAATSDSVRFMVKRAQKDMQRKINAANKKSGRDRKKSYSDMAALMNSVASPPTPTKNHSIRKKVISMELVEHPDEYDSE